MSGERHYRLYDEGRRQDLPRRAYKTLDKAIDKTLSLLWRLEVGNTFTVYSIRDYKGVIQFTRRIHGIEVLSDSSLRLSHLPSLGELHNRVRGAGQRRRHLSHRQ